ncbi:hypothetical protein NITHO_4290006 [Nitrolancea hollandica Lb]|uniref:Uncharacterized protein n=1 Tax=Nitrolancea hollandica Lb TaxID=1129897 RepID=I4EJX5_9BACT|nr:hypothetical protein NITHO_4290006 [Nitrolancea hollandica Lb]
MVTVLRLLRAGIRARHRQYVPAADGHHAWRSLQRRRLVAVEPDPGHARQYHRGADLQQHAAVYRQQAEAQGGILGFGSPGEKCFAAIVTSIPGHQHLNLSAERKGADRQQWSAPSLFGEHQPG